MVNDPLRHVETAHSSNSNVRLKQAVKAGDAYGSASVRRPQLCIDALKPAVYGFASRFMAAPITLLLCPAASQRRRCRSASVRLAPRSSSSRIDFAIE